MELVYVALLFLPLALYLAVRLLKKPKSVQVPAKENDYERERNIALNITPALLKLAIPEEETLVYGVIVDLEIQGNFVSLACYITGAANLLFSAGRHYKGGGKIPAIGEAGVALVTDAQEYLPAGQPVKLVPDPAPGDVHFVLLTNKGKFFIAEKAARLDDSSSQLLDLFNQASQVILLMRQATNVPQQS